MFSRLYIACQSRDGNLDEFFCHENQPCPPSISLLGKLRLGSKSDLLTCLERCIALPDRIPNADIAILDGAVIVNFLTPVTCKTFDDYALKVFLSYTESQLQHVQHLNIVWDASLKQEENVERVSEEELIPTTNLPTNWQQFLRINDNKVELFANLVPNSIGY